MESKSSSGPDEKTLVKQLSKGNLLAFNALFKIYGIKLYHFAYRYLKSKEESEELVQEVFTIVWERRKDLKHDLSFKSYLFTISYNIIKKHFRARTYLTDYYKEITGNNTDTVTSQKVIYNSFLQFLNEIVNKLPKRRKEIFIKSRYEGLSIKEISDKLGISHKTVENQLTDALKYIRSKIEKENQ